MKYLLTVISLFTCAALSAQVNLVKNPSLEQYSQCPNDFSQIRFANYWSAIDTVVTDTLNPPLCSPEYCNTCATDIKARIPNNGAFYQYPRTGTGMAQVQMFYDESTNNVYKRDYLQGRLWHPLIAGKSYCVTLYTVLEEFSDYQLANIGAYLDNGNIDNGADSIGCASPQTSHIPQIENISANIIGDTLNWTKIEGTFVATGTEKFITIGNFRNITNTNYQPTPWFHTAWGWCWYLIDDVSVIASDAVAYAGHDTAIGFGDSVFVGLHDEAMPCTWTKLGSSTVIHEGAGMWAKPTATTKYIVKQTLCGVSTYDTVTITVWPQSVNNLTGSSFAKVYPNPANNHVTFSYNAPATSEKMVLTVCNLLGQTMCHFDLNNKTGQVIYNTSDLPAGVYIYKLTDQEAILTIGKLIISR